MSDKLLNIFKLHEGTVCTIVDEEKVFVSNELTNTYAYVSKSALQVIEQIDGEKNIKQITDTLTDNKSVAEDYEYVYNFINNQLNLLGFLKSGKTIKKSSIIRFSKIIISRKAIEK